MTKRVTRKAGNGPALRWATRFVTRLQERRLSLMFFALFLHDPHLALQPSTCRVDDCAGAADGRAGSNRHGAASRTARLSPFLVIGPLLYALSGVWSLAFIRPMPITGCRRPPRSRRLLRGLADVRNSRSTGMPSGAEGQSKLRRTLVIASTT